MWQKVQVRSNSESVVNQRQQGQTREVTDLIFAYLQNYNCQHLIILSLFQLYIKSVAVCQFKNNKY